MIIIQKPTDPCFQKGIADIILQKEGAETSATFTLLLGAKVLIEESYQYDVDGLITIRDLEEIVAPYLVPVRSETVDNYIETSGCWQLFYFSINGGYPYNFAVLKSECVIEGVTADEFMRHNFLTRLPNVKKTAENRNEYLTFFQHENDNDFTIHYKAVYVNPMTGQPSELTGVFSTSSPAGTTRLLTFNASVSKIRSVAGLLYEKILSYSLWFTSGNVVFESSKFDFMVDPTPHRHQKLFLFENAFGALETFVATGIIQNKKEIDFDFGSIQNRYRKITQDYVQSKTCNSGYLNQGEMNWIDDMFLSYFASELTFGVFSEISITGLEKTDTSRNEIQSFTFNYRRADNNHLAMLIVASSIFDHTFDNTYQ